MGQRSKAGQTSCRLFYPGRLRGCATFQRSSRARGIAFLFDGRDHMGARGSPTCAQLLQAQECKSSYGLQGGTRCG